MGHRADSRLLNSTHRQKYTATELTGNHPLTYITVNLVQTGAFCFDTHSKKCWVKYNPVLGKYLTEHMLGCFQPTVGLNV